MEFGFRNFPDSSTIRKPGLIRSSSATSFREILKNDDLEPSIPSELFVGFVDPTTFQIIYDSDSNLLGSLLEPTTRLQLAFHLDPNVA